MGVTNTSAGSIGDRFTGFSYEKDAIRMPSCFNGSNSRMMGLYQQLGPGILRLGGNSVDSYTWNASGPGRTVGEVAPTDIDALGDFLRATGWKVIYGVNLASNLPYNTADEVAYAVKALGSNLAGVEIGNEPDLYFNHLAGYANWKYPDFRARWQTFSDAIHARTSSAPLMGPSTAGYASTYTIPFAHDKGSEIVALTQHYYRGDALSSTATVANLLSYDSRLDNECGGLGAAASSAGIPFRISETNSYYNNGPDGVVDSFASALWIIDHFFHMAALGAAGANVHGGGDSGFTPIWDSGGVVKIVRPLYYGMRFFTMLGQGKIYTCNLSVSGLNVTAYAVETTDGQMNLMLLNKDPYQNIHLSIDCGRSIKAAEMITLEGPALNSTSGITIQASAIQLDGTLAADKAYTLDVKDTSVQCYLNAKSAALITLS
jgi:hypothetical protein